MTSTIKQQSLIKEEVTIATGLTISANNAQNAIASVAKSGYKPLAITAISKTGAGSGLLAIGSFYIAGDDNVSIQFYNPSTTSRTIGVIAEILYQRL